MKNLENWRKQENALSNDVFYKNGIYCKKYSKNNFNNMYGNKEQQLVKVIDFNIFIEGDKDYFCLKEIPGIIKETKNLSSIDIENFSKELKRIHNIEITDEIKKIGSPNFQKTWNFLKTIKEIPTYLNEDNIFEKGMEIVQQDIVIANNDIVEGNILFNGNDVRIIDYEYGGINSKYFDIASFIIKRLLSKEQEKLFLESYFKDEDFNLDKLLISKEFCKIFWSKWAWFKYIETKKQIYKEIAEWLIER